MSQFALASEHIKVFNCMLKVQFTRITNRHIYPLILSGVKQHSNVIFHKKHICVQCKHLIYCVSSAEGLTLTKVLDDNLCWFIFIGTRFETLVN